MVLDAFFRRASETFPIPVMLRALLERVFEPARLNDWFEAVTEKQYTRELLFSSAFELMSVVVFKAFGSVHAAYQAKRTAGEITVSVTSVYNKLNGVEAQTSRALVRDTAGQLRHLVEDVQGGCRPWLPGYRVKVLDGSQLHWVRLFFVEDFSPYSWALLPADASPQWPFREGHQAGQRVPASFRQASRASSRRRTPSVFSPTGALPSGHSRGVLVRCRGKGGRPAMAVTTGFQGRTFDVPRTGVPCIDPPRRAPCAAADAVFADAKAFLSSSEARQMSESELERELHRRGQELVRKLLQGHRDQRSPKEAAGPAEGKGTSGVECSEPREHESPAETASGTMQVVGLGCARRGHDGLHRLDAALNLLPERYLVEMRRRVTIATASRAPPRTPWKPPWYSTSSTWQRRRGVRCSSPAHRRACRHLVRDPMGDDRRTVTLGSSCGGPQPPRVAGALMRTEEEPGQRGAGARPGQAAVTGALSHASCSPPHRSTRPGALCGGGGFFRGDQSLPFFARGPADA